MRYNWYIHVPAYGVQFAKYKYISWNYHCSKDNVHTLTPQNFLMSLCSSSLRLPIPSPAPGKYWSDFSNYSFHFEEFMYMESCTMYYGWGVWMSSFSIITLRLIYTVCLSSLLFFLAEQYCINKRQFVHLLIIWIVSVFDC